MRIWITGICGFIGGHLADVLCREHEVRGNDNRICSSSYEAWETTDCCDFNGMKEKLSAFKPDVLVHTAATPSEGFSVFSPHFITKNIAEASVSIFSAAIASSVKRIVHFSSMARYGKGNPPFKETDPTNPIDPYAHAKVYAENQLKTLCNVHGVKWSICVPHNVVGKRQQITPYRNVLTIFLNRLKLGMPIYIYGDGEQKRSFSPISDCLHSLVQIVEGKTDGEIVNIGPDGNEITINELLSMCEKVTGVKAERVYLPPRPLTDTVKEAHCSSEKARKLLGYKPQQQLIDCIREMAEDIKPTPFKYDFPLEIMSDKTPRTWAEKLP